MMNLWSPGEGNGNPLWYSCLENPMDVEPGAGYSPWGCKESDMTEQLLFLSFFQKEDLGFRIMDKSWSLRAFVWQKFHYGEKGQRKLLT